MTPQELADALDGFYRPAAGDEPAVAGGLQGLLEAAFPIAVRPLRCRLEDYRLVAPIKEAAALLRAGRGTYHGRVELVVVYEQGATSVRESVNLGEVPLLTERGTFVIRGEARRAADRATAVVGRGS